MHILDVNEKNFISIIDDKITIAYHNVIKKQVEHLLEKEKEQIKEAWYNGGVNGMGLFETNTGEEYYNETYFQQEDKTFKQKSKWTSVDNTKH